MSPSEVCERRGCRGAVLMIRADMGKRTAHVYGKKGGENKKGLCHVFVITEKSLSQARKKG